MILPSGSKQPQIYDPDLGFFELVRFGKRGKVVEAFWPQFSEQRNLFAEEGKETTLEFPRCEKNESMKLIHRCAQKRYWNTQEQTIREEMRIRKEEEQKIREEQKARRAFLKEKQKNSLSRKIWRVCCFCFTAREKREKDKAPFCNMV